MKDAFVMVADRNQYMESDGNALIVITTIFVVFVIMGIDINYGTDFIEYPIQILKGEFMEGGNE